MRSPSIADASVGISLSQVSAQYFPDQRILDGVSLDAPPGEITLIIGPNGSGKSTALRVLAGLLQPVDGRVLLSSGGSEPRDITRGVAHKRSALGVAFVPQGHSGFPALSVHDNLVLGGWPIRRDRHRVAEAVAAVYDRYPALREKRRAAAGSLSGGQQRILELGRCLVANPRVMLIDEPSAGVAPAVAALMYDELRALRAEGRTIVLVDQDLRPAMAVADNVHVLRSGRVDKSGDAKQIGSDLDALVKEWLSVDTGDVSDQASRQDPIMPRPQS